MLYFITGNKLKFTEVQAILPNIEQMNIDLAELQEIDPHKIIQAKLIEARKHHNGEFIVEDTSLYLDCLNGLPGPLIKWFLEKIGNKGLFEIAQRFDNFKVVVKDIIGYIDNTGEISFFEGNIEGKIVYPGAETTFGLDPIFMPEGFDKSFAEMTREEKNEISHRRIALDKLKDFLNNKNC